MKKFVFWGNVVCVMLNVFSIALWTNSIYYNPSLQSVGLICIAVAIVGMLLCGATAYKHRSWAKRNY